MSFLLKLEAAGVVMAGVGKVGVGWNRICWNYLDLAGHGWRWMEEFEGGPSGLELAGGDWSCLELAGIGLS